MKRLLLLIPLLCLFCAVPAAAAAEDRLSELVDTDGLRELAELPEGDTDSILEALLKRLKPAELIRPALRSGAVLLCIMTVFAAADALFPLNEKGLNITELAGAAAIMTFSLGNQRELIGLCTDSLEKLQDFSDVLLPAMSSAAAACGKVGSAPLRYAAAVFSMNVLMRTLNSGVLPLLRLYLAAAAGEAVCGNSALTAVLGFLRWLIRAALTVTALAFSLYISLTALGGSTADAAMVKTAKTALAAAIPVVGGIASDAAAAVLSSAELIRRTAGITGLLGVAALLLIPFARLGINYIVYKSLAVLGEGLFPSRLAALSRRLSESIGLLLGCLGTCGLLLYFSVFSLMGVMSA